MLSTMMDRPLLIRDILRRAERIWPDRYLFARTGAGDHRFTYRELGVRVRRLANALTALGVGEGDRIGSLAWNTHRQVELYYGAPVLGAALHTLNLRLPPEQLTYVTNHAGDKVLFVDRSLLPLLAPIRDALTTVEHVVVMDDGDDTPLPSGVLDYEELLDRASPDLEMAELDERTASGLCYTSGTTGQPKAVAYSHRSNVLHALSFGLCDTLAISNGDTIMAVAPLFHANGWGLPYAAPMLGANLVLPGRNLEPEAVCSLIASERVTVAGGVPTVVGGMLDFLDSGGSERCDISCLRILLVGGAAVSRAVLEGFQRHGVTVLHAWGMTETSPMGTASRVKSHLPQEPGEEHWDYRASQGIPVPFVELELRGDDGREVAWDGRSVGEIVVRGPWVTRGYVDNDAATAEACTDDGWFRTGDVATIDSEGYVRITDRSKDLIKSGGEWISSIEIENRLMEHPAVQEAAVIAIADPKWDERPLACVVMRPGAEATDDELSGHLAQWLARWQLPDRYERIAEVPKTSVGKFDKKRLRVEMKEQGHAVLRA